MNNNKKSYLHLFGVGIPYLPIFDIFHIKKNIYLSMYKYITTLIKNS